MHVKEQQKKALLTAAVADLEPLTAPFEVIAPLLDHFTNSGDAHIIHWFVEQWPVQRSRFVHGKQKQRRPDSKWLLCPSIVTLELFKSH